MVRKGRHVKFVWLAVWAMQLYCYGFGNAVSYDVGYGRFGDQLLTYCKAKWLAYKHDMQLFYKPFKYSDRLLLHTQERHYSKGGKPSFSRVSKIQNESVISVDKSKTILYIVNFYTKTRLSYEEMKKDSAFISELRRLIRPGKDLQLEALPSDVITVAMHVRKGGGFDAPLVSDQKKTLNRRRKDGSPCNDRTHPAKFPPDSYYIEQLQRIDKLLNGQALYVYIFTDDQSPEDLAKKYQKAINKSHIVFDYRKQGNAHNKNVIEDFFSMMRFDCLIRPSSSFSRAVDLLGNYKIVVHPKHCTWKGNTLTIDDVHVVFNGC